jgi:hypothetical protein
MAIQRYRPGDSDLPNGKTYHEHVHDWMKWAVELPEDGGTTKGTPHLLMHLKKHSLPRTLATTKNLASGKSAGEVYYLGGYWDCDPDIPEDGVVRTIEDFPGDKPILINCVSSSISREEHPNEFPKEPTEQDLADRAKGVIDGSTAAVTIEYPDSAAITLTDRELDRIHIGKRGYRVNSDVWKKLLASGGGIRDVNAASDGYWLFLKRLGGAGTYTIHIHSNSPVFGGRDLERFRINVTYKLNVS